MADDDNVIRDWIFPIFEFEAESAELGQFRGTGFFVGSHRYALTAAHVLTNPPPKYPLHAILDTGENHPHAAKIETLELHP